jgi:hypothetical protein
VAKLGGRVARLGMDRKVGRGMVIGGQREGTVVRQQYTASIVPSSMGDNSSQAGSKIQTMS